jgi:flagellar hook-length control protein FliK
MPAIINLPASPSPAAAKFALDGGENADMSATDGGGLGPFAALFRNLLDKQMAVEADAALPLSLTETEAAADTTTEDLDALLPFLDAMGLTQADPMAAGNGMAPPAEATPEDIAANALAVTTPPTEADAMPAIPAGGAVETDAALASIPAAKPDATSATPAVLQAGNTDAATKEASQGREFSTQLVAAIENSKEQAHTPGGTASAVHQVIAAAAPQNAHAARTPLPVAQPVGSSGWSEEVGNRIAWMATRMESRAELVLTPPQMGRVEVSLSVTGDQASASFVSANPAVREALEAALPRLREVLADAGIQLGQAQVGAENARQSAQQEKNGDNFGLDRDNRSGPATSQTAGNDASTSDGLKLGRGLVDVFA